LGSKHTYVPREEFMTLIKFLCGNFHCKIKKYFF